MNLYLRAKQILILVLLGTGVAIGIQIYKTVAAINNDLLPSLHQGLSTLSQSAANLRTITGELQEYAQLQLGVLRSNREQKAIQAGLEVAAALKGSVLVINKSVLPRVNKELDALTQTTESLNALVAETNNRINSEDHGLLPQSTETIKQVQNSLMAVQETTNLIGEDIHRLTSDNALPEAISSLADASKELDLAITHAEQAMKEAPTIAGHIENITGNSSKVSKIASIGSVALIAAKILALVF